MSEVNFKNFKQAYMVTQNPAYRDNDIKLVLNQIYPYVLSMTKQLKKRYKTVYLKKEPKLLYLHCGASEDKYVKLKIGPSRKIKKKHHFPCNYDLFGWLIDVESTFDEGFKPSFNYDENWSLEKFKLQFERFFLCNNYQTLSPLSLEVTHCQRQLKSDPL